MKPNNPQTGYAVFDSKDMLIDCNEAMIADYSSSKMGKHGVDKHEFMQKLLSQLQCFDSQPVFEDKAYLKSVISKWSNVNSGPIEVKTRGGLWKLLTSHPLPDGGTTYISVDISERKHKEVDRREKEKVIQHILDNCPVPIQMAAISDKRIIYRNPAHNALFGPGNNPEKFFADPKRRRIYINTVLEKGELDHYEDYLIDAESNVFLGSVSVRLAEYNEEQVIVSVVFDETKRKAAQDQLNLVNERLIDAIESLSHGFAIYGPDDCLILSNQRYKSMNAEMADILKPGLNWFDLLRVSLERNQFSSISEEADEWLAERAKDRRESRQQEYHMSDGTWEQVVNYPTREGGFVVTRLDITEKKKREADQHDADELIRNVLEACAVNIQMMRAHDGKILYTSPASKKFFGNRKSAKEYHVDIENRNRYVEKLMKIGKVDNLEMDLLRENGEICQCSVSSRLIKFNDEDVIVSHTYDMTKLLKIESELNRQREIAHQSEKLSALGELLAGVAHELNNPLSIVLGQSLLLSEMASDKQTKERAKKIGNAADRCARIVKTFLAMARQQPEEATNIDLNEVIESALEIAGYSIRSADIDVRLSLASNLPETFGDSNQFVQVVINLLINAEHALRDWNGRKSICIESRYRQRKKQIILKISDTGPGIPAHVRTRIFEPFYTTKDIGEGTGIGLAFCHRIMKSHNATIHVDSVPGNGTAFHLIFPVSQSHNIIQDDPASRASKDSKLSVLVVDDEEEVAECIAQILETDGHHVIHAGSCKKALKIIADQNFSLILSDLKMPQCDGREFYEHLSNNRPNLADRIGFITGDTMSDKSRNFLESSNRPYLEKPVRPDELREFVDKIMKTAKKRVY